MQLTKQPGESNIDFHKRLVYGKLVDKTLADVDYSELAPVLYGQDYAGDNARKMMYGSLRTLQILDEDIASGSVDNPSGAVDATDMRMFEIQKERQKFFDQRNALMKMLRTRARQEEVNEIIKEAASSGSLPVLEYMEPVVSYSDRDILVSLNDIHYGAVVDNYWHKYDPDICKMMFEKYLARVIQIGEEQNAENCIIWCNGDEISGNIHYSIAVTNKETVVKQVMGVSELIAQFIAELSKHFNTVKFVSIPGNHSRINPDKDMALEDERLDDFVEWWLEARLQNFKNVQIHAGTRIDPTMYTIDIRGNTYVGVHGDFDFGDKSVMALQTMVMKPVHAVLSGHLHHNKIDTVQGIKTVMAGSFLGMDSYCVSKRIFGRPEQLVCVVGSDGIICSYDVAL